MNTAAGNIATPGNAAVFAPVLFLTVLWSSAAPCRKAWNMTAHTIDVFGRATFHNQVEMLHAHF